MKTSIDSAFRRLILSTFVAVFFLVLVGGVVRSSGSGMGCPDWPKCFGQWVPPRSAAELPPDYLNRYDVYRQKKNMRFAQYLDVLGFNVTANRLRTEPTQGTDTEFNVYKTWTEYINRLIGVIVGFFILALATRSLKFRKSNRKITVLSFITLAAVIFQGWLGSIVVSSNLTPWTVTLHMIIALIIIALLATLIELETERTAQNYQLKPVFLLVLCMVFLVVQVIFGTQVREQIDVFASVGSSRSTWIEQLGSVFTRHRSFSWIVLIADLALVVRLWRSASFHALPRAIIVLILGSILSGTAMAYFGVPAVLQPVHLLLATLIFGLQFMLLIRWSRKPERNLNMTRA